MIEFRYGQAWKREGHGRPHDAFVLELDGVDLLSGASEEPLERIVPDLVDGLGALVAGEVPLTGVPLPHAHLELLIRRAGTQAKLEVVSLARPARRLYGPLTVDLEDLAEAAVACGRSLLADFASGRAKVPVDVRRKFAAQIERLARTPVPPRPARETADAGRAIGWSWQQRASEPVGFAFTIEDPSDLALAFRAGMDRGALGALTFSGGASLVVGGETVWKAQAPPFLLALELARQGQDLVHALELEDSEFGFSPGGTGRAIAVDLKGRTLQIAGGGAKRLPIDPDALAGACFDFGQRLALALRTHAPAQAKNPWLEELLGRCREGSARMSRGVEVPPDSEPSAPARKRKPVERPLQSPGRIRRLRFAAQWQKSHLSPEEPGTLVRGRRGPVVVTPEQAIGFSVKGELLFRAIATHGVATATDGYVVAATTDRVVGMPNGTDAGWLRDHDGAPLGPELCRKDGLLVVAAQGRGALAFNELTGREIWRLLPPRTGRAHLSVQGHRALLATDGGLLYGMDLEDGQLRYRIRSALPHLQPPVSWGRRALTVTGRGDHTQLSAVDVHDGRMVWTRELPIAAPSRPLVVGGRVVLAGTEGGAGVILCLSARGGVLWQRPLNLGEGPFGLLGVGRSVVVASNTGSGVMFDLDGVPEWRVGSAGDALHCFVPPRGARGVVLLAGEVTRAVDPRGGRVMAEVRTGAGLCGLQVDPRLNLYALDEDGTLTAWRLSTSLAVV